MIKSMTGFARARRMVSPWGRVSLEIRSVNHRFLDIVLHFPDGFFYLEQKIRDEISRRIKRGHILCRIEINTSHLKKPFLNKQLIQEYYVSLKQISRKFQLKQDIDINALAALPGVWSVQTHPHLSFSWGRLRPLLKEALDTLVRKRQQEGRALYKDLRLKVDKLERLLAAIRLRSRTAIKQRLGLYETEEEKNAFLKSSDINEEIVRLSFHLKNLSRCLRNNKAVGKELDFILQEMQREANTVGAKSIDAIVSGKVIGMKDAIEKMREQVQNVE
ncbi:YicC/YloC family endoribonuclease [Candidatus Omnitrophota bacterium]